jgi:hypothetical protein
MDWQSSVEAIRIVAIKCSGLNARTDAARADRTNGPPKRHSQRTTDHNQLTIQEFSE